MKMMILYSHLQRPSQLLMFLNIYCQKYLNPTFQPSPTISQDFKKDLQIH